MCQNMPGHDGKRLVLFPDWLTGWPTLHSARVINQRPDSGGREGGRRRNCSSNREASERARARQEAQSLLVVRRQIDGQTVNDG